MSLIFSDTHIDVARNSTDDFNLFHDKKKWYEIHNNPFNGPIVLGFQLLGLIAQKVHEFRNSEQENIVIDNKALLHSYYQVKFASAVKPSENIELNIKKSQFKDDALISLSNRFSLSANNKLALIGYKKELSENILLNDVDFSSVSEVGAVKDRSFIENKSLFVKHKYLNTSNGKNFLVGCLVEQSIYFDEINDKVNFPEIFPLALSSCALLERAHKLNHDFRKNPMVYVSHQHSINKDICENLRSNTQLSMLVENPISNEQGQEVFNCYGLVNNNQILFRSELSLMPLEKILTE